MTPAAGDAGLVRGLPTLWRVLRLALALLLGAAAPHAAAAPTADGAAAREVTVFVRAGCPHCADAKAFLDALQAARPGLRVVVRDVVADPGAARDAERLSLAAGVWPPGVPIIVVDGTVIVGFDDAEHMGRQIEALIDRGAAPTTDVPTRWFGTLSASAMGLPAFTLALGLLDGFNPCAMWVLLFLLSLLVRLHDRRRMALIAGTFVAVSGAVYYAFMAARLNVFLVIGMSNALRWTLAGVALVIGAVNGKDFVAFGRGVSFSIPEAAKPGLYARVRRIVDAPTLAVSLVAVAALGQRKLTERAGRWLKLVSGVVMLALGAVLALRPHWLM